MGLGCVWTHCFSVNIFCMTETAFSNKLPWPDQPFPGANTCWLWEWRKTFLFRINSHIYCTSTREILFTVRSWFCFTSYNISWWSLQVIDYSPFLQLWKYYHLYCSQQSIKNLSSKGSTLFWLLLMQNTTISTWITLTLCPYKAKIRDLEEKQHESHAWCFISKLSLYAHSVNPLFLLQRLILFISGRKVVCLIEIKVIIFHACTRAATGSYTFTAYYLSKVSWLRNTLFPKLKVRKVPGIISSVAFSGVGGYLVFPACQSVSDSLNLRARLSLIPSRAAGTSGEVFKWSLN